MMGKWYLFIFKKRNTMEKGDWGLFHDFKSSIFRVIDVPLESFACLHVQKLVNVKLLEFFCEITWLFKVSYCKVKDGYPTIRGRIAISQCFFNLNL